MKKDNESKERQARSECPIAGTLDILGDRWTLLIVRDMLMGGKRRYGELLNSPEGIPTNILADRLRRMESVGLLEKKPYHIRPIRYEYTLTPKGQALEPILNEMIRWGLEQNTCEET